MKQRITMRPYTRQRQRLTARQFIISTVATIIFVMSYSLVNVQTTTSTASNNLCPAFKETTPAIIQPDSLCQIVCTKK